MKATSQFPTATRPIHLLSALDIPNVGNEDDEQDLPILSPDIGERQMERIAFTHEPSIFRPLSEIQLDLAGAISKSVPLHLSFPTSPASPSCRGRNSATRYTPYRRGNRVSAGL
jgi:hypothetical protein